MVFEGRKQFLLEKRSINSTAITAPMHKVDKNSQSSRRACRTLPAIKRSWRGLPLVTVENLLFRSANASPTSIRQAEIPL